MRLLGANATASCLEWIKGLPEAAAAFKSKPPFPSRSSVRPLQADAKPAVAQRVSSSAAERRVVEQWQRARKAAGLRPLYAWEVEQRRGFMLDFYSKSHGAQTLKANAEAEYVIVWKAANNMLRLNLAKGGLGPLPLLKPRAGEQQPFRFTFVREPLEHFASGFAEFVYRHTADANGPKLKRMDAEVFVHALLDGELTHIMTNWKRSVSDLMAQTRWWEHLGQAEHFYPMSGVLPTWPLDWVGRLEGLRGEWASLRHAYANRGLGSLPTYEQLNLSAGRHISSADPYGMRAALLALLRRQRDLKDAICTLLEPDYTCFGYSLVGCDPRP